jgi:hypothetical protein
MALLDDAIEARGGLALWNRLKRFTLQLSIAGELITRANGSTRFKDIVAEGYIRNELVRFTGFSGPDVCGVYRPSHVTIEDPDGEVLRAWRPAYSTFTSHAYEAPDEELYLISLCGLAVWQALATPFVLSHPDAVIEELSPWLEQGQLRRRIRAELPPISNTRFHEQTLYFDATGLQRRTDHDLYGLRVADYSWAHQEFDGIVVPTLRRSLALKADGTVIAKPALVDLEIFDAAFE